MKRFLFIWLSILLLVPQLGFAEDTAINSRTPTGTIDDADSIPTHDASGNVGATRTVQELTEHVLADMDVATVTNADNVEHAQTVTNATNVTQQVFGDDAAYYYPDNTEADQGVTAVGANDTIYDIMQTVGTSGTAVIVLRKGTLDGETNYALDTSIDLTTYPNIFFEIQNGARLTRVTGDETITFYSPYHIKVAPRQQITSVAMIDFAIAGEVYPQWWGALGNNANDDGIPIQWAIDSNPTGTVVLPAGIYLVGTSGITLSDNGTTMEGDGCQASWLYASAANVALLTITGQRNGISEMGLYNQYISTVSTHNLITLNGAVEAKIHNVLAIGGYYSLTATGTGADNIISDSKMYGAYGTEIIFINGSSGTYLRRMKLDQAWPVDTPSSGDLTGAWAATTAYALGEVVTYGGFYYQCSVAGTSGGAFPGIQPFGTPITDGTATWYLAAHTGNASLSVGSDSYYTVIEDCDHTGVFDAGIKLYDSAVTNPPQKVIIRNTEIGATISYGILVSACDGLLIESGTTISSSISSASNGIYLSEGGDVTISGSIILGHAYGIFLFSGVNTIISNNQISGCSSSGVYVAAGVSRFNISNNSVGASPTWGANTIGIQVATGASDYYNIVNNLTYGAGTGVSDAGTGSNKTVSGNN